MSKFKIGQRVMVRPDLKIPYMYDGWCESDENDREAIGQPAIIKKVNPRGDGGGSEYELKFDNESELHIDEVFYSDNMIVPLDFFDINFNVDIFINFLDEM